MPIRPVLEKETEPALEASPFIFFMVELRGIEPLTS